MPADIKYELETLRPNLFLQETEDTWEKIGKALTSLIKLCENGAYDTHPTDLVAMIKAAHRPIISAMNSERTRLCLIPMDLMGSLGHAMGMEFDQILPLFIPPLLTNCARTNKIVINRAKGSILTIIEVTQLASVLTYFLQNIKDKSASMKLVIAEGTLACLNSCNPPDIEKEARALEIEGIIRITARDASADVRKVSRKIFESYMILLPSRVQNFTAPLSPTTKKYLDVKPTAISNQKSTSNLRSNVNLKPEVKSKPSAGPSSSTTGHARTASSTAGHARTASSSTLSTATAGSYVRSQSTTMTRVNRKEPAPPAATPAPYVPVRPVQPSRVVSETGRVAPQRPITTTATQTTTAPIATRTTTNQETKRPIPPLRTQSSTISRVAVTTTGAPHRVQMTTSVNHAAASSSQTLPSTGPRRIPMPPPPPPAPKKETEGPKRPASRVDNGASTTSHRSFVPSAPIKKPASAVSSSLRDRAPPPKPPVNPSRPKSSTATADSVAATTSRTIAGTNSKQAATAKAKPMWGRSAPPAKPVPASQKAQTSVPAAKSVSSVNQRAPVKAAVPKKPTTRVISGSKVAAPVSKAPAKELVIPEMVALPPSPPPAEEEVVVSEVSDEAEDKGQDENVEDEEEATPEASSERNSSALSVLSDIVEPTPPGEEAGEASHFAGNDQSNINTLSTIVNIQPSSMNNKENAPIPKIRQEVQTFEEIVFEKDDQEEDDGSLMLPADEYPRTPQQGLKAPLAEGGVGVGKTPISALLSSIERGFNYDYSPITPLSPPDCYLPNVTGEGTPYSHRTHAPHLKGPMQPFNHALHAPGFEGIFGGFGGAVKHKEEMVRGDLGVVHLSEYNKVYKAASLPGLDDGRQTFFELNKN